MEQTQKTVMLVDDDRDYLNLMQMQLEAAGYKVATAESEAEGEELLRSLRPDVAVVDLMMENMDGGFVLCHRIKKLDPKIPVIMVTAVSSETGIEFDAASDKNHTWFKADALLTKPARFEQLKREIERLLREYSS
jgi:CheY-like chemotaxis protein